MRIFVSYRRDDVPDASARLADSLVERFGSECVFFDRDSIDGGADFTEVIRDYIEHCDVLLAVIGDDWLQASRAGGQPRIQDPDDNVRLEIEAGLRCGVPVFPVLIHTAGLPASGVLPDGVRPMLRRNASQLSRTHWRIDVERLITAIEKLAGRSAGVKAADRLVRRLRGRERLMIGGLLALVLGGGVVLALRPSHRDSRNKSTSPSAGSGGVVGSPIAVGSEPAGIAVGQGGVWVTNIAENTVMRIDPRTDTVVGNPIAVGKGPGGIAVGEGSVWVANNAEGTVMRIDPSSGEVLGSPISVGKLPVGVAVGESVWVTDFVGKTVMRIDPSLGEALGRPIPVGAPFGIAVGGGVVWVANSAEGTVTRIAANSGKVLGKIAVGRGPLGIAVGQGGVWVANSGENTVTWIDPSSGKALGTIPVGRVPYGIAVGQGGVWVANSGENTVTWIDPSSGKVLGTIAVGKSPTGIAVGAGNVWVANRESNTVSRIVPR
jgi:YVTN family beta-propeller protein